MVTLDFAVIGAAKAGTTSLWEGVRRHPQIAVPSDKERAYFDSDARHLKGLDWFVQWVFGSRPDAVSRGIVTPGMMPADEDRLEVVVERVAAVPDLKVIVILRDPLERAVSKFRQELRAGFASPEETLAHYLLRLAPQGSPWRPSEVVSVGEYGRILSRYANVVPRESMLVLFTSDLEECPQQVFRQVFRFLGVDEGYLAPQPRVNVGGSGRRVTDEAMQELVRRLDAEVFGHVPDEDVRRGFLWWLQHIWNIEPDDLFGDLDVQLRQQLASLYLQDADVLRAVTGIDPPWRPALLSAARAPAPTGPRPTDPPATLAQPVDRGAR